MTTELDLRRRRAAWRAAHRGTKEMDVLLGRYAEATLAGMDEAALARFEDLLQLSDPQLQGWLLSSAVPAAGTHQALIDAVRRFHGLPVAG